MLTARGRGLAAAVAVGALTFVRCGDGTPRPSPDAGVAPYAADGCPVRPLAARPVKLNVVLVCLDTVRADALDPPAGQETLMPRLAAWAKTGVRFPNATAPASWTGPSVTSLLTGLLPSEHGARDFASFRLVDAVPTLAEVLRCQQWQTIAYTGGVWVSKDVGVMQGFEAAIAPFSFGAGGADLLKRQTSMREMPGMTPYFLFLHTYEAHDPYGGPPDAPGLTRPAPPPGVTHDVLEKEADGALALRFLTEAASRPLFEGQRGAQLLERVKRYFEHGYAKDPGGAAVAAAAREAYASGVRRLDAALGDYLEGADRSGLLKDAIVIVTSDHGEGFGEHGSLHHGRRLYDELLRVPLVVRAPGWPAGKTVGAPVSTLDVVPTVCGLLGLPLLASADGASLEAVVKGGVAHPCVAEELRTEAETGFPGAEDLASIRDARWKWILTKERGPKGTWTTEIYDLAADPGETHPLPGGAAVTPSLPFEEARGRRVRALGK